MLSDTSGTATNLRYAIMYEKLTDLNVLYKAYQDCRKGVDWKSSTQLYGASVFQNINKLCYELENGTYKQKPFVEFDVCERGKTRHIHSLHISDRVLQKAICDNILTPTLRPYLIYDNGASVKGKGVDFTRKRLQCHLQKFYRKHGNKGYILLIDFSKFFDSIPHDKLLRMLESKIDDERVMQLLAQLIATFDDGSGKSLGIGSQTSQSCGIYYPTPIDNYCKIVKGCKYYGRYMDDIYIIHEDKAYLKALLVDVRHIAGGLGLELNEHKTQIFRLDKGFTFLKVRYILTDTGRTVRKPCKANLTRERRKLKAFRAKGMSKEQAAAQYQSWRGNIAKLDSYKSLRNMDRLFYQLYGRDW